MHHLVNLFFNLINEGHALISILAKDENGFIWMEEACFKSASGILLHADCTARLLANLGCMVSQ